MLREGGERKGMRGEGREERLRFCAKEREQDKGVDIEWRKRLC